jgi:Chemoreceptor zinc-binding domain
MDWMQIINAHVMWKQRLLACIEGRSEERLDPDIVSRDDQCVLGKWIYGEGRRYDALPEYESVREQHARFHTKASEVVRMVRSGDQGSASVLLHGGYSKISEQLKHRLLRLRAQVRAR